MTPAELLERVWYPDAPRGWVERVAEIPLSVGAAAFGIGVASRGALYARGVLPARRITGARVISVGNLTVGGSGKTPAVIHLAARALAAGRRVAVLSRGYGRRSSRELAFSSSRPLPRAEEAGDEPLLIASRCPGVAVMVGPDRARLAERARSEVGAEVILLDDGMQHRRLGRDVEIVVIDESVGFGNGRLLPWGPLREPLSALERADLIWLRVAEGVPAPLPPLRAPVVRVRPAVEGWIDPDGQLQPPEALKGRRAIALAGIARPRRFLATLERLGVQVEERVLLPDHGVLREEQHLRLSSQAARDGLVVVSTEKDRARLPRLRAWAVRLRVEILEGEEALRERLGF